MRWLLLSILFSPILALASNNLVTLTITPSYAISMTDAQLICSAIYANLPTKALIKIERLIGIPYSCTYEKKQIKLVYTLKSA